MGIETVIIVLAVIVVLAAFSLGRNRRSGGKDNPNPPSKS
jgi:hypothetical protein